MTKKLQPVSKLSRRDALTVGLGGLALGASIWKAPAFAQSPSPIKVGFPVPLTGPYGSEAADQVRCAQLAIEDFNKSGGLNGRLAKLLGMHNFEQLIPLGTQPDSVRALGLGKVVGTTTMGAVIATGTYSLIDGSTIRTPGTGVYLADEDRTNLENHGVKPDVYVENSPEDNLAGRDRQLEVAVREVMKGLKPDSDVAGRE